MSRLSDALPSVSVVVATADREELLQRAACAIMQQDYAGFVEVIVVRDGGMDENAIQALAQAVQPHLTPHRDLRQIPNSRTKGLPGARNSGIVASEQELIAFCDDDDQWLPGKLQAQVPMLQRHSDASCVATGITVVHGSRENHRLGPLQPSYLADLLADRVMELHPSTFLFRRNDLLTSIGLVDEELPGGYAEDYDLLLRAATVGPVLSVPQPLTKIYWHASSYYFSKWQMIDDALQELLVKHPQFAQCPTGKARITGQQAIALSAMGRRSAAVRKSLETLWLSPRQPRAWIALLTASGLVSVGTIQNFLHRHGRGL